MDRSQGIIRTSWIGIIVNVMLDGFKAVIVFLTNSVAIIMDAVNNLSDALSSVITIVGTKPSQRPADRKHPFGFGRIEYFSAIIIAVIVLSAGITSLIESVKKIFDPTEPEYTTVTLVVIVVAIVAKLILGQYVKRKGEQMKSDALIASGSDALFDAVITLATLTSAGVLLLWVVSLDGFYYSEKDKYLSVDVVPDISVHDETAFVSQLTTELQPLVPDQRVVIVVDHNYTECSIKELNKDV